MLIKFTLMSFPIIAVGRCATTNLATFVALLGIAVLTLNRTLLIFAVVLLAFTLILMPELAYNIQETAQEILMPGKTDFQLLNLHGRLPMWERQLALAKTSPFVGHGFIVQSRFQGTISAHNAFVQAFLDTGFIGLIIFSFIILMFLRELAQRWNIASMGLYGCTAAFISVFVHSLACPFVGAQWLAASFTFAAFAGLYVNHIYGVTNDRLPHLELEYERCLGYKIVS